MNFQTGHLIGKVDLVNTEVAKLTQDEIKNKPIVFTPLGEAEPISLTVNMVRSHVVNPTAKGKLPSDSEVLKFLMLCKARMLNPWTGDAFLVGYDGKDGPNFSLITAAQALLKRAENCPEYDGMESGIIVQDSSGEIVDREGDFDHKGDTLLGGWAKVYRKDQSHPSTDRLKFSTYSTGRSRWNKDGPGMIVKCAESSALRKAFPLELGGLFTREEMDSTQEAVSHESSLSEVSRSITEDVSANIEQDYASMFANCRDPDDVDELLAKLTEDVSQEDDKAITDAANARRKELLAKEGAGPNGELFEKSQGGTEH